MVSKSQLKQIGLEISFKEEQVISDAKEERQIEATKRVMEFIQSNRSMVNEKKSELDQLKEDGNKSEWMVKANTLVQMVSQNDFTLGWSNIYTLIKHV